MRRRRTTVTSAAMELELEQEVPGAPGAPGSPVAAVALQEPAVERLEPADARLPPLLRLTGMGARLRRQRRCAQQPAPPPNRVRLGPLRLLPPHPPFWQHRPPPRHPQPPTARARPQRGGEAAPKARHPHCHPPPRRLLRDRLTASFPVLRRPRLRGSCWAVAPRAKMRAAWCKARCLRLQKEPERAAVVQPPFLPAQDPDTRLLC